MTKLLFLLLDGFGDVNTFPNSDVNRNGFDEFFSQAKVPNIYKYFIASPDSYFGMMDPIEPGVACGSDTAHLSLFGFDPIKNYSGRGAFETIGAGIEMNEGEIAFKCNFAFMNDATGEVISRRADLNFAAEAKELCDYLQRELNRPGTWLKNDGVEVFVKHATEHRCGLKIGIKGRRLSSAISGTDPLIDGLKYRRCEAMSTENDMCHFTANLVQRISDEIRSLLSKHPINITRRLNNMPLGNVVLFRGCAESPSLISFDSNNNVEWNGMMMAKTCIISGLGQSIGFRKIHDSRGSEDNIEVVASDLDLFLNEFQKSRDSSFGFFHIKIVDDLSHDYDLAGKIEFIEQFDGLIGKLVESFSEALDQDSIRIVLTGDHTTLCRIGEHSCESVPLLISCVFPKLILNDNKAYYGSEYLSDCFYCNNIGRISGGSLMNFLKHLVNKNI